MRDLCAGRRRDALHNRCFWLVNRRLRWLDGVLNRHYRLRGSCFHGCLNGGGLCGRRLGGFGFLLTAFNADPIQTGVQPLHERRRCYGRALFKHLVDHIAQSLHHLLGEHDVSGRLRRVMVKGLQKPLLQAKAELSDGHETTGAANARQRMGRAHEFIADRLAVTHGAQFVQQRGTVSAGLVGKYFEELRIKRDIAYLQLAWGCGYRLAGRWRNR